MTMFMTKFYLNSLVAALFGVTAGAALAAGAGQIQHLSGTLSVQRPDGSVRILSQKSEVNPGEVLTTQKDSYAQINMTDGSSMTLRPNTQVKIENYQFVQDKPQDDSAFFRLVKGGLRTVTGLVGKRGNQDAYRIGTATATIGIRGSSGETLDCTEGCDGVVSGGDKIDKGVYHTTYTGSYIMQNEGGSQIIGEGQFGFVKNSKTAPQILPNDPGLNLKDLPFVLGANTSFKQGQDCVVK
jgi:hypothetical protein